MPDYFSHIHPLPGEKPQLSIVPNHAVTKRSDAAGLHPYAAAIRDAWCNRLDQLRRKPWQQGDGWDNNCFVTARKLTELANSPWSGYTLSQAQADYLTHAPHDHVWDGRDKCWRTGTEAAAGDTLPEPAAGEPLPTIDGIGASGPPGPPTIDEAAFWKSRPILEHIHNAAQARMVAPWAVLGVTIARALALVPTSIMLPPIVGSAASLNFAVALVAPSGGGKGGADGVARDAVTMPAIPEYRIGSGEAIAHCLKYRLSQKNGGGVDWLTEDHNAIINITEVDKLTAQAQRNGATIMPELRAAWSGEALGHVTADASRRIPVEKDQYRLSLILGVQPTRAAGLLEDSGGGFPQRLIWLPATDPAAPPRDERPGWPGPWGWAPPNPGRLVSVAGNHVEVCEQARQAVEDAREQALRGTGDPLDGHLLLAREKVAAAFGVLEGRYSINDEDWRLAGEVVSKSNQCRAVIQVTLQREAAARNEAAGVVAGHRQAATEDAVAERVVKRLCSRILKRFTADWTPRKVIANQWVASRDRVYLDEALLRLVDAGQIDVDSDGVMRRYRLREG